MKIFQSPLWLLALILFLYNEGFAERIVVFHGISSYSHRVQTWPLAEALSARSHQVSYISPYTSREPNPNITELVPKKMFDFVDEFLNQEFDIRLRVSNSMRPLIESVFDMAYGTCEALMASPELHEWIAKTKKVDLFIIDNCFAECGFGVAHRVGARKVIIFNTVVPLANEHDAIGVLPQSSVIPELETNPPKPPMGFFERLSNTMMSVRWYLKHYFHSMQIDALLRESLKVPKMPYIGDLVKNVSLVLYTGDVVTDYPRALPPLYVNVAGTHVRESTKALPKEMELFINSTKPGQKDDGFIYISLGSIVISSNLPDNIKQVFFDVVKSFPTIKFLWKWAGDIPKDIPENLYLAKWYPQIDVLGHPKIRAFVTQSGRPSTLEALNLGVPMISFPILGDQDINANRMAEMGATIPIEIGTVTFTEFRDAVQKVVYDPRVKERMTRLQKIFRDRPQPPVETGIWWIEYVLRNEDTAHFRPAGQDQYWFVRRGVDVWAFLSISAFVIVISTLVVLGKLMNFIVMRQLANKPKQA